jgi:hypothetical protein
VSDYGTSGGPNSGTYSIPRNNALNAFRLVLVAEVILWRSFRVTGHDCRPGRLSSFFSRSGLTGSLPFQGRFSIAIGEPIIVGLEPDASVGHLVGLGEVNGLTLNFTEGVPDHANATKSGNTYRVTGTASGSNCPQAV